MSERGSWVTEYIYCAACAATVQHFVAAEGGDKYFSGEICCGNPIFGGRISAMASGEELQIWEIHLGPMLAAKLCHPVRIAVLAEGGQKFYTLHPGGEVAES